MNMQTQPGSSSGEINFQTGGIAHSGVSESTSSNEFVPRQPSSLVEAGLHRNDLFPLFLKFLFLHGNQSGGRIASQIRVPYGLIIPVLESLTSDMLIGHQRSSGVADDEYELSPKGIEQARIHLSRSTYCGSATVTLVEYRKSILRQSVKNLKPTSLCDEAFLRRIPYKVEVFDPTEVQFRNLFKREMSRMNFQVEFGVLDHLIEYHYKRVGRSFRFCHVLDLLNQCRDFCEFHRKPNLFSKDICELAVLNYFSEMGGHLGG
jgi:hypothetical protein